MDHLKFKMLASGYPPFMFPKNRLEEVDSLDFYKAEKECLPLFIGTQFGVYPKDISLNFFEGGRIAILEKSLLSGVQSAIIIYEINNGERVEILKIPLKEPFWNQNKLKKYQEFEQNEDGNLRDLIPKFYIYEIWNYLEVNLNIKYYDRSLSKIYHLVTSKAYSDYVIFASRNTGIDWNSFLCTEEAEVFLNLYRILDQRRRELFPKWKDLPLPLENQLRMFRNIRNPFQQRSKKNTELPAEEDLLVLSNLGLCIYYNNHININSLEAEKIQQEIIMEFKHRDFYVKNEFLLKNHANPIETKVIYGTPVLSRIGKVAFRTGKDIAPLETGTVNPLIMYEHFYGRNNSLTDMQLVQDLNMLIGLNYWGMGRAAVIRAVRAQLKKRGIDTSSINSETSFSLGYCVVLHNKKLLRLGDLPEKRITPIFHTYLRQCYPHLEPKEIRIVGYGLFKMQVCDSSRNKFYELPINDLIKKKGEIKSILAPEK